jgi:hypothetical protein
MSGEAGGWTWILMDIGAVAVLAAALAYGLWTSSAAAPLPGRVAGLRRCRFARPRAAGLLDTGGCLC